MKFEWKRLLLIIGVYAAFLISASSVNAVDYTIIQITNNDYYDKEPVIDGNKIVWYGDGPDYEIFLYDIPTKTITRLTENDHNDWYPSIDNNHVVWLGWDGHDYEIFLYDISAKITTQVTNNDYDEVDPDVVPRPPLIDGNQVVWNGWDGHDYEIFLYDIDTKITTQVSNNDYHDWLPHMDSGKIVWHGIPGYRGEGMPRLPCACGGDCAHCIYDILIYDTTTEIATLIKNRGYGGESLIIDNDQVVLIGTAYLEAPFLDWGIFFYDIPTDTQTSITHDLWVLPEGSGRLPRDPSISDGKVAWGEFDGQDWEILLYDTTTKITTQLTNNTHDGPWSNIVDDGWPQIDNGQVVWGGWDGYSHNIFLYDIASGRTTQVTNDYVDDLWPNIDNGRIVWEGFDGHEDEIYLAMPTISATLDIHPDTLNLKSNGKFVTCYIEIPEDYSVGDINRNSVTLSKINDNLINPPLYTTGPSEIGDYDNDNIPDLMLKFDRQKLISLLETGNAKLTVSGKLIDETLFEGNDTIRVIERGKK